MSVVTIMTKTFVSQTIQMFSRRRSRLRLSRKRRFIGKFENTNPASDGAEIARNVEHCKPVRHATEL